jgi:cytoskeletal protein RodZ
MAVISDRLGEFGPRMKRVREERGVSLRHIAEITKISVRTLEALERDDVTRLPGGIFSRSIVRAYAKGIGADPEGAVREFIARFGVESVTFGSPHAAEARAMHRRLTILAAILVPLVAILVWSLFA